MKNTDSLDSLCGALAYAMGIEAPKMAAAPNSTLCSYVDQALCGKKADRIFMYNPDAIAQWIYEKYSRMFHEAKVRTDIDVPFCTVMPSVTPVCFATMYTGAQPDVHGIKTYTKPVITIDTIFDALIRNGKKAAIVSTANDSMSRIFLEKEMDYFIYETIEEVNAKACELILEDTYDFIAVYNGNYDGFMHKYGPEGVDSLAELRDNVRTFGIFYEMIKKNWANHNTLIGFAMDHGCHPKEEGGGTHGSSLEEDLNIVHRYKAIPAKD